MFGCMAKHKPENDCRWDYETYTCNLCTKMASDADLGYHVVSPNSDDWLEWRGYYEAKGDNASFVDLDISMCGVLPLSSYTDRVPSTRDECLITPDLINDNVKPSIGNDGRFCVCVKPNESFEDKAHIVTAQDLESAEAEYAKHHEEAEEDTSSIDDVHELYQSHFDHGTYRILKSGTYKIMEDIVFDFNAGDLNDPNVGTSWWPTSDQQAEYPGAGETRGSVSVFGEVGGLKFVVFALNNFRAIFPGFLCRNHRGSRRCGD